MPHGDHPYFDVLALLVRTLDERVAYLVAGGIPSIVYAGSEWSPQEEDLDVLVRPEDADRAEQALVDAGFAHEESGHDWLRKATKDGVTVDILFRPDGDTLDDEMLARAVRCDFHGTTVRLVPVEDFVVMKVAAFKEETPGYWHEATRALARTQVDWSYLLRRSGPNVVRVLALLLDAASTGVAVPIDVIDRFSERARERLAPS